MDNFTSCLFLLGSGSLVIYVLYILNPRRLRDPLYTPTSFGITYDSDGFTVAGIPPHSTEVTIMPWFEVDQVAAHKVIAYCDFNIYLQLLRPDGTGVELNMDMAGWKPFCEVFFKMLPGCRAIPSPLGIIADEPSGGVLYKRDTISKIALRDR